MIPPGYFKKSLIIPRNFEIYPCIKELKIENIKIAYVHLGDDSGNFFYNQLNKYTTVDWVKANSIIDYNQQLKKYDITVIGFHKSNSNPWKDYKFSKDELMLIQEVSKKITLF